jgi:AbrB family looped-hinge helix DNA binding protein
MHATVSLGKQGRVVIPADVRTALELHPGDQLTLYVSGRAVVLEARKDAVQELRALGSTIPRSTSLVEELLAERLRDAERE